MRVPRSESQMLSRRLALWGNGVRSDDRFCGVAFLGKVVRHMTIYIIVE